MKQFFLLLTLACTLIPGYALAQDPNVSLLYGNPAIINPAMVGLVEGSMRFNASHRWRRAGSFSLDGANSSNNIDYQTTTVSGDFLLKSRKFYGGAGGFVATDKVPGLRTTQLQAGFAYEAPLGIKVRYHHLRIGFLAGMHIRSLNQDELLFADQFDDLGGFTNPTGENFGNMTQVTPDLSAGLLWYRNQKIRGNVEFNHHLGFAAQHVTRPNLGFYDNAGENASIKYTAQFGGKLRTRAPIDVDLAGTWTIQNNAQQLTLNLFGRYIFFDNGILWGRHKASVMAGLVFRTEDALIGYLGFEYKETLAFGLAFDLYTFPNKFTNGSFAGGQIMASYLLGHRAWREPDNPFPFF